MPYRFFGCNISAALIFTVQPDMQDKKPWESEGSNQTLPKNKWNDPNTGYFVKGNPGRKKGSKNATTLAVENMMEGEAEEITRCCIDMAKAGDPTALKLIMERIAPVRKGRTLSEIKPKDGESSIDSLLRSVLEGDITPEEGKNIVSIIEGAARVATHRALSELRAKQIELMKEHRIDPNRVMIVPGMTSPEEWEKASIDYQAQLVKDVAN